MYTLEELDALFNMTDTSYVCEEVNQTTFRYIAYIVGRHDQTYKYYSTACYGDTARAAVNKLWENHVERITDTIHRLRT